MKYQVYLMTLIGSLVFFCYFSNRSCAGEAVIKGKIIDNNDRPVKGAEITVTDTYGNALKSSTTNLSGTFSFSMADEGYYNIKVNADGFYNVNIIKYAVNPDTIQNLPIILNSKEVKEDPNCLKGSVSGVIVTGYYYEPVPGVEVQIRYHHRAISQVDGSYKLSNLPDGKYDITATAMGFAPITIEDVIFDDSECYYFEFSMVVGILNSDLGITVE
jgi:hypothetical protein